MRIHAGTSGTLPREVGRSLSGQDQVFLPGKQNRFLRKLFEKQSSRVVFEKCETSDHAEVEKSKRLFFLYMTPPGLRKVSVGQKPHKNDFPKLEISEKHDVLENRNLPV